VVSEWPDGPPVAGAWVRLESTGPDPAYGVAECDSQGRFRFEGLPQGDYRLQAERDGFEPGSHGATQRSQSGAVISLSDSEAKTGLGIRLRRLATVSGTVIDPRGDPVAGEAPTAPHHTEAGQDRVSNGGRRLHG